MTVQCATSCILVRETFDESGFTCPALAWANIFHRRFEENNLNEVKSKLVPKDDGLCPLTQGYYRNFFRRYNLSITTLCHSQYSQVIDTEIDVLEILSRKLHSNIIEYYGCICDGDYIADERTVEEYISFRPMY